MNPTPAPAPPPPRRAATAAAGLLLVGLLGVNLPGFVRTALDCDPLVFDLYVRDAGRGRVLYRDMLENNTPAMIAAHAGVRWAFGWSSEALRAADVLVVGAGVGLLAGWVGGGRRDRTLLAAAVLAAVYLSATEWCHCQRDVWVLLPVGAALRLRRQRVAGCCEVTPSRVGRSALEGIVWGVAVWLKPHLLLVAAAVWLTGVGLARSGGTPWRRIGADLAGLVAGGLLAGAAGVAAMMAAGVWEPYLDHLLTWAGEYPRADFYGPHGRELVLVSRAVVNLPWSLLYVAALPAGTVAAVSAWGRSADPSRSLLGAALTAWAGQAVLVQHVFDYVHLPAVLLAVALLLDVAGGRPWPTFLLALAVAAGHAPVFAGRLAVWADCFAPPTPALRDRLARFDRLHWGRLQEVAAFLHAENCRDGEVSVLSDTALPLYTVTGLAAPTRYYIPRNNLLAYRSRRPEIMATLADVPAQRFAVVDLSTLRTLTTGVGRDDGPLGVLGRWADRSAFRAGRYVVLRLPAADVPAFLRDATDYGACP